MGFVVALHPRDYFVEGDMSGQPTPCPGREPRRPRQSEHVGEPTGGSCRRVVADPLPILTMLVKRGARRFMTDVLELADVSVVRSGQYLLNEVTWAVSEGDRWVVLGPNGAGKTTLLQVASAQIHPTTGYAAVLGEILGTVDVFELRPRIGLTSAALADRIPRAETVRDVVVTASYAVLGRWRERYEGYDDDQAGGLLERLGVGQLADRTFGTLSEGERKRVQIARALMTDPEVLLLDEPAAGLDLGGREALVATLGDLAADPRSPATVLVTHHVEEIPTGFTHALLLRAGRVVALGPVEETITDDALTECFGLALVVNQDGGRWTARAR